MRKILLVLVAVVAIPFCGKSVAVTEATLALNSVADGSHLLQILGVIATVVVLALGWVLKRWFDRLSS